MRGLCKDSNIDSEYKLKFINNSIVFMGVSGTEVWLIDKYNVFQLQRIFQVKFVSPLGQEGWALKVNLASTTGFTSSGGTSFGLGNRSWTISDDATKCNVQVKV